jgi:hypothetical protein
MTNDEGVLRGPWKGPTVSTIRGNLDAALKRCAEAGRPYPPLLLDLRFLLEKYDKLREEADSLRWSLESAADRFADLVGEGEYGEVAAKAGAKWLAQAREALDEHNED